MPIKTALTLTLLGPLMACDPVLASDPQHTTSGVGGSASTLDVLLTALDANLEDTLHEVSATGGWPAAVNGGYLVVSTDLARTLVAGEFSSWKPTAMTLGDDFAWAVIDAKAGGPYKLTDGAKDWVADPWSRVYGYDDNGEMSFVAGTTDAHLERHLAIAAAGLAARTVRVWRPASTPTRVLYVHDGQNLFDPTALFGGWKLADAAPDGMMLVGIDNTPARMAEYTHVPDDLGDGPVGGKAAAYATLLKTAVRPIIQAHYGEPPLVGVMGSSLGGLVSLAIADASPGEFQFAASLSGTLGWGSVGAAVHNETMLARHIKHGHQSTVLYVDSGGDGGCADTDNDGVADDGDDSDNYCVTQQFATNLLTLGYTEGKDLFTFHEPGATHNEAAWAARAYRPLEIFATLAPK